MQDRLKSGLKTINNEEGGYILILVLVMMLLGTLIVIPFLGFMSTGASTGVVFEEKTNELYAANAGIEDGKWQIKYDHLETTFAEYSPDYSPYDYSSSWSYDLTEEVNSYTVNTTIQNYWIPKGLTPPSKSDAERIIRGIGGKPPKVMVTGTDIAASTYEIKIQYYPDVGEELRIETIGVWLPVGFTYVDGSGSLDADPYNLTPVVGPWAGGQAITWSCDSYPFAGDGDDEPFPEVDPADTPMESTITFQYSGSSSRTPEAISWVDTNLDLTQGGGGTMYTWDTNVKVYKISSMAGDTEIEAYIPKSEMRKLDAAIDGDYQAVGNSLMARSISSPQIRDILLSESSATVEDIPPGAYVELAYLYWSGWFKGRTYIWGPDDCSDFVAEPMDWAAGSAWEIQGPWFIGYSWNKISPGRYLAMNSSIDLSSYSGETVKVSWLQWDNLCLESDDALQFQFSGDGGSTWSGLITAFSGFSGGIGSPAHSFTYAIPDQYLTSDFRMRFYLEGFNEAGESAYLDDIAITHLTVDTSAIFKIDGEQVYYDVDGNPRQGDQEIIADPANPDDRVQVIDNTDHGEAHGYSYSCRKDVTGLVREYSDGGNAAYTVGSVDATFDADDHWAYAGWSLVVIYSSADTEGHQLYLYDDFLYKDHDGTFLDYDQDGSPGGIIEGFIVPQPLAGEVNAARITAFVGEGDPWWIGDYVQFNGTKLWDGTTLADYSNTEDNPNNVWNSESIGMSAEGVDVDTFYIPWSSGLLEPGDTSAELDIWTDIDVWNLVYIILSLRSETTTGGVLGFLVH